MLSRPAQIVETGGVEVASLTVYEWLERNITIAGLWGTDSGKENSGPPAER